MLAGLGEAALRTFLLTGLVGCGLWVARVRHPQLLLAAWTVVLAASLSMPMLSRLTPLHVPVLPVFSALSIDDVGEPFPAALPSAPAQPPSEDRSLPALQEWVQAAYFAGLGALLARLLLGIALSLRLVAKSVPVHADWVAGRRVRISRDVEAPVTVARTILLPADAERWSLETRRAVLAHEQAHVARADFLLLVLAQLNRAVFWFNPVSWWLHRKLVLLSELASDDQAIVITRDAVTYAEILLEMGQRSGSVWRGPAMARPSTLASRIGRILDQSSVSQPVDPTSRGVIMAAVTSLSIAAAILIPDPASSPATAPQSQPLITSLTEAGAIRPPIVADGDAPVLPLESSAALGPLARDTLVQDFSLPAPISTGRSLLVKPLPQRLSSKRAAHTIPPLLPRSSTQDAGDRSATPDQLSAGEERRATTPTPGTPSSPPRSGNLDVEQVMSSTCTGRILVGLRAQQSSQPKVVAGQEVESTAQFFRKDNGAPWVRFFAFGRPPLDLPVHLTPGKMTWTGEYGISYAVQPWGENRLVGLAALIATDSARLEFTCRSSKVQTL